MRQLLSTLALRNTPLYYFGWACLAGALVCALLTQLSRTQVGGVKAWLKPLKCCCSICLFVWTMGWYLGYLGPQPAVAVYTWVVVGALAFELLCIAGQAARGQRSHFNVSSPLSTALSVAMGVAIVVMTWWTAYIALVFGQVPLPGLPSGYAWAIRLGIGLFVVFALQGGLMVSRQAHTVGGPGLPVLHWSTRHGDLRVAHFLGMHALQVLPLLAWYGRLRVPGWWRCSTAGWPWGCWRGRCKAGRWGTAQLTA